ncbi:MAG TPA: tRNA glutamyl-Q(34) synthetase GluQRS [Methylibium sp.]|uniref:tRNA glutamyl-Q(34) synthetase GluQRS n=1 Tax=Methylibium sp. TaxID=2067992 RepID=UPI002DB684A7|nr:tRNA glutamyl-Q(34) synthetase GluQRS [Methylibium sp.]HEU4457579.1 tRNA glutamyl-Q(34) synthetase GluQRS [Methylibium sp.]
MHSPTGYARPTGPLAPGAAAERSGLDYCGRFAPSPTGPLHAGSLVAALASWLDARAHDGRWLVRIEDVDLPRCIAGADRQILGQLEALGLVPDEAPIWQSKRGGVYAKALQRLVDAGLAYPCGCTRAQIAADHAGRGSPVPRHGELAYPGSCRPERGGLLGRAARAWRFRVDGKGGAPAVVHWQDRRLGAQSQDVERAVGDFVLKRADGLWAYQLAVVVDDAEQGVTDVVRGEDLLDNTPRQLLLQSALGVPAPRHLHLPLVRAADGEKLSKRHGAAALALAGEAQRLATLGDAARALGLPLELHRPAAGSTRADWLARAVAAWGERLALPTTPTAWP